MAPAPDNVIRRKKIVKRLFVLKMIRFVVMNVRKKISAKITPDIIQRRVAVNNAHSISTVKKIQLISFSASIVGAAWITR